MENDGLDVGNLLTREESGEVEARSAPGYYRAYGQGVEANHLKAFLSLGAAAEQDA